MKITANSGITADDVRRAEQEAREAGACIYVAEIAESPRGAITFYCEGSSNYRPQHLAGQYAATWSAWGWLIACLYRRFPNAKIGHYKGIEHFITECERSADWQSSKGQSTDFLSVVTSEPLGV